MIMLALLMPHIHQVNLLTLPVEQGGPVGHSGDFHLLWFHGSVPSIVSYLGDIRKLRRVFIIGSFIPLVAYIFWQLATLGSIDAPAFTALLANNAGLNGLLEAIREVVASPHVGWPFTCLPTLRWRRHSSASRSACLIIWRICFSVKQRRRASAERDNHLPAAAGVRPVLSPRFRHGPRLRRGGISRAGADNAGPAGHEESPRHPQATAGRPAAPTLWLVLLCGIGIVAIQFSIAAGLLPAVG